MLSFFKKKYVHTPCISWNARISKCTRRGIVPFSLRGASLAGHSARFRISPMTAFTKGQREGGCKSRAMVGMPPWSLAAFCATSHSGCRDVRCRRAQTAGSVISSLSPAAMMVPTKASIPPNRHTLILFFPLFHGLLGPATLHTKECDVYRLIFSERNVGSWSLELNWLKL